MPKWLIYTIVAVLAWTFWGIFIDLAGQKLGAAKVTFIAVLVELIVITVWMFIVYKETMFNFLTPGNWVSIMYASFAGIAGAVAFVFFTKGYQTGEHVKVSMSTSAWPILMAIAGFLIFKEKLTWEKIGAFFLITAGMALLAFSKGKAT